MKNIFNSTIGGFLADQKRKRLAIIVFVPLLIIAMLLTTVLVAVPAFTATGDGWDLTNFVTGVVVRDSSGNTVSNGNYLYGENYTFSISFAEKDENQFVYNGGYLTYTLPSQLQVVIPVTKGDVLLPNGMVAGHYNLDANGNVQVWFDNVDNQGAAIDQNFIDRYQNATFTLDLQAQFQQGCTTGTIDFGADATITVTQINEPPAGVKVTKGASAFNGDTETIDFTVIITAVGGPMDTISLADVMKLTGDNIPSAGYTITSATPPTGFQYQVNGAGAWNSIAPTWSGTTMNFNFGSVGTLQQDQYITLKYSMPLSATLDKLSITPSASSPYIQRLMYNLNLNNDATATGRSTSDKTTKTDEATTNTPLKKTFLTKTGSASVSGGTTTISWTASAGDGSRSLNGLDISDWLYLNENGNTGFPDDQDYTGNITVDLYGYNNGNFTGPVTVTITPIPNPVPNPNPPDKTVNGLTLWSKNGFTYTVPNGYGSIADIRKVVFHYQTAMKTPTTTTKVANDIAITLNGNVSYAERYVPIGAQLGLTKTSQWIYDASGNPTDIQYTVKFYVPAGQKDQNLYIVDYLNLVQDYTQSWQNTGYQPTHLIYDFQASVDSLGPGEPALQSYYYVDGNPSGHNLLYIVFGTADDHASESTWQYDTAKTVTLTYKVSLSDTITGMPSTLTIRDLMQNGENGGYTAGDDQFWGLVNQVMDGPNYSQWGGTSDYWPIQKVAAVDPDDPTVFDYTVYLNPCITADGNITQLFKDIPSTDDFTKEFADTFDSRLQYVDKSFYVQEQISDPNTDYCSFTYPPDPASFGNYTYGPYNSASGDFAADVGQEIGSDRVVQDPDMLQVDNGTGTITADFSKFSGIAWTGDLSTSTLRYGWTPWCTFGSTRYIVHYKLQVKPDNLTDSFTAQNTATVYPNTDSCIWTKPFSSSATVKYGPEIIKKNIADINGNVVDTNIVINENGLDLVPDTPAGLDKTQFTAVDTMSGDLALYLSTIQIYTQTGSKGAWSGTWKTTPETINTTPGALFSINYIDAQHMEIVLPNNTPVMITYKALITVPVGSEATFNNTMSVYGYSDFYAKDKFLVQNSAAGAFADDLPITLYKQDQDTGQRLTGASFGLYVNTPSNGVPYTGYTVNPAYPSIAVGGKNFYYIGDGTDMGGGAYRFYDSTHGLMYSGSNNTYLIVETAAPSGYQLPASPNNRTFFVLRSLSSSDKTTLQTQLGATVNVVADTMTLTNVKQPAKIVIEGDKKVIGDNIPSKVSFQFALRELNNATSGNYKSGGVSLTAYVNDVQAAGTYHFAFAEIDNLTNGTYWYEVKEVNGGAADWTYDTAPRVVTVTVTNGKAEITGISGGDNSLTFTNTCTYSGVIFPAAGGIGRPIVIDIGIGIILLVSVSFGGTLIYRHRKRRRCLSLKK